MVGRGDDHRLDVLPLQELAVITVDPAVPAEARSEALRVGVVYVATGGHVAEL